MPPRMAVLRQPPPVRDFCLGYTVVQPCCTGVSPAVFLYFAFLDARGFIGPLNFLEIAFEVFFSIEIQGFLLKARQNTF